MNGARKLKKVFKEPEKIMEIDLGRILENIPSSFQYLSAVDIEKNMGILRIFQFLISSFPLSFFIPEFTIHF